MLSDPYRQILRSHHEQRANRWGTTGHRWAPFVSSFAHSIEARTVLDYGCGQGTLGKSLELPEGCVLREYDPGIPGKDSPPQPADCVVSTDVLEHVEPELVDETLRELAGLTLKGAYHAIALSKAGRRDDLPDGRNAHLSLFPPEDWLRRFKAAFPGWELKHHIYTRNPYRPDKCALVVQITRGRTV